MLGVDDGTSSDAVDSADRDEVVVETAVREMLKYADVNPFDPVSDPVWLTHNRKTGESSRFRSNVSTTQVSLFWPGLLVKPKSISLVSHCAQDSVPGD
jgi:hypothetical protein